MNCFLKAVLLFFVAHNINAQEIKRDVALYMSHEPGNGGGLLPSLLSWVKAWNDVVVNYDILIHDMKSGYCNTDMAMEILVYGIKDTDHFLIFRSKEVIADQEFYETGYDVNKLEYKGTLARHIALRSG